MESNIDDTYRIMKEIKLDTKEDRTETIAKMNSALSSDELEYQLKQWASRFTPEYLLELSKKCYEDDRNYPENFSNWYYKILDFGYFKSVDVISNQIFTFDEVEELRSVDRFDEVDWDKINKILSPTISKMSDYVTYNIKNGCFSNKFEFDNCNATKKNIAKQLWKINYRSAELETGGYTELVVREKIPYDYSSVPIIYGGMPLREELRVFYNMDTHKIEYISDYWDYEYCRNKLTNKTDMIIFDWFHNKIPGRDINHNELVESLKKRIEDNIYTLKFSDELKGIWSIDFMYVNDDSNYGGIWLIDMARGFRSAYWDVEKCNN